MLYQAWLGPLPPAGDGQSPIVEPTKNLLRHYYEKKTGASDYFRVGERGALVASEEAWNSEKLDAAGRDQPSRAHDFCWVGVFKMDTVGGGFGGIPCVWNQVQECLNKRLGQSQKKIPTEMAILQVEHYTPAWEDQWDLVVSFARKSPPSY